MADRLLRARRHFASFSPGRDWSRWLAAATAAMVLGSACSGPDADPQSVRAGDATSDDAAGPDSEPDPDSSTVTDRTSADDAAHPERVGAVDIDGEPPGEAASADSDSEFTPYEERVYPLSAFLGELESEVYAYRDYPDPMTAIEDMKYDCMTEQGFRYAKIDWAAIDAELDAALPSLAEEDYMPLRGYGVADSLDAPEVIESEYVDPNDAIKQGLSDSELEAWEQQRIECVIRAQKEVFERPGRNIILYALRDELTALDERIAADPRLAEAARQWSLCMAEQGHRYRDQDEIFDYLHSISDPLLARLQALGGPDHIDATLEADIDALMAVEVEIAVADLFCKDPLEQAQYDITVEHEEQFLQDHQDRLGLLRQELPTMTLPPPDIFHDWFANRRF